MKKKIFIGISILLIIIVAALAYGVNYLFNYAIVANEKDFLQTGEEKPNLEKIWDFSEGKLTSLSIESDNNLALKARYITQEEKSHTTVIVAHGYMGFGEQMGEYAELFYNMGYDVLIPDDRAHGESEGEYIGFGWLDRLDYVKWINEIIQLKGESENIILFGVSMGASTVMMTSGENLPSQVKLVIADCGYTSVQDELSYQLKEMFNLPSFPLIPLTSAYTKIRAGYSFKEASAVEQLKKNELPLLLIHGDKDDFVPTKFVYPLYEATKGPKELVIFEGANHGMSIIVDKELYTTSIEAFISTYLPESK